MEGLFMLARVSIGLLASELYLLDAPPAALRSRLDYISATLLAGLGSAKDASYRQARNRLNPRLEVLPPLERTTTAQNLRNERNPILAKNM